MSRSASVLRSCAPVLLSVIALACDPGSDIYGRNDSSDVALVRLLEDGQVSVFALPPAFDGYVYGQTAGFGSARMQLINPDCTIVATVNLPVEGSVLLIITDDTITATAVELRKSTVASEPVETESPCASLASP